MLKKTKDNKFNTLCHHNQMITFVLHVAVCSLANDSLCSIRCDFHKEVRIMSQLRDPNIVQVLGVLTEGEPLGVIVEYMAEGDLNQFLQNCVMEGEARRACDRILRYC